MPMGLLINADFKKKLDIKLYRFDPKKHDPEYHAEIFSEMFNQFPQFKAHVAAYIERNYCFVVNDEDHSDPSTLLTTLQPEEVRRLNEWILLRNQPGTLAESK
jgi:hypothetical protein